MRWAIVLAIFIGLLSSVSARSITPPQPEPMAYVVPFDAASAEISPAAQVFLDQALADYRALKPSVVHVNGHCHDPSITRGEAELFSRQMAESVRDYLAANGVPPGAIELRWFVDERPVVLADDAIAQAWNRSVDILFDGAKNAFRP